MKQKKESIKPKYISIYPCGKDLLEGKSHEKIAQSLLDLIQAKAIPNNVVGLEGEWGSGKSNVIDILADKFNQAHSDYVFYKYDTWAHQEDLTRRSFLDGLISFLKAELKLGKKYNWILLHKKLLAKVSVTNVEKNPKVKLFYILFLAVVFSYNILRALFNDFFGSWDLIPNFEAPKLKEFLFVYLVPLALLIWGIIDLRREYLAFSQNEETKKYGFSERLKRLLYVFSGTDLHSEELIERVEDEPSIQKFKKYFSKIQEDLNADGLIIVFDNMDRLYSPEKVLSIWSSIHTFFAEEDLKNVWVLVPYDREHLAKYFREKNGGDEMEKLDNFIGKTFTANFMIAPPILSDWKRFFHLKFKEAFNSNANENQIETVSSLYEVLAPAVKKKPRDIINFINEMVTLALQHKMEIELSYMALFLLRKDMILEQPLPSITSKNFLKQEAYLFQNEKELEQNLAALVYNIEKERSGEILLRNGIEAALRKYSEEAWEDIMEHSEFKFYFNRAIVGSNLANYKPEIIAKSLEYLEEKLNAKRVKVYWDQFAKATEIFEKEYFLKLEDWHYKLFSNASPLSAKKVAKRAMDFAEKEITNDSGGMGYYTNVHYIIKHVNKHKLKFKPEPNRVKFSPEQMLEYIDDLHNIFDDECTFEEMNIYASSPEISKHFIDHPNGMVEESYGYKHVIKFLYNLKTNYTFESLRKKLGESLQAISGGSREEMKKLIELNKILCPHDKKIPLIPENNITPYIDTIKNNDDDLYLDAIANQIAHLKTTSARSNALKNELAKAESVSGLAPIIQYYVGYGDLLEIVIDNGQEHELLSKLIRDLTQNTYGRTQLASAGWMLRNLDKIETAFFEEDLEIFLKQLDRWDHLFENAIKTEDILEIINADILNIVLEHQEKGFKCIQLLIDTTCKKLEGMSREEWLDVFNAGGQPYGILVKFVERKWVSKKITKGADFMGAYEDFMEAIAGKNSDVPDREFWDDLLSEGYLDERKMSKIYNDVFDILLAQDPPDTATINFFAKGLFTRATDIKSKSKDFIRKILFAYENDLGGFDALLDRFEDGIIEIINIHSGEYNHPLSEMLTNLKRQHEHSSEKVERLFANTELEEVNIEDSETETDSGKDGQDGPV